MSDGRARKAGQRVGRQLPVRQQYKQMTSERVIDASVRVFLERGYADSTIDDIVAAAEVGRATFYLHFKSKLEVMRAIIQAKEEQNEALIKELRADRNPTPESLEGWLRRFVSHWSAEGDRFLVGLQALASEPELSGELEVGLRLTAETLAKILAKKRRLPPAETALRAELLVGALQQACRALVTSPQRYDVDLVVRVVAGIWIENLLD